MSLTWQGKLILAVILVAVAASVVRDRVAREEVQTLASLTPCRLALHYVDWRVEFAEGLAGADAIEGRQLTTFVNRNSQYAKAAQEVVQATSSAVAQALLALTRYDSDRSNSYLADAEPFLDAFFETCPSEAMAFTARIRAAE